MMKTRLADSRRGTPQRKGGARRRAADQGADDGQDRHGEEAEDGDEREGGPRRTGTHVDGEDPALVAGAPRLRARNVFQKATSAT